MDAMFSTIDELLTRTAHKWVLNLSAVYIVPLALSL